MSTATITVNNHTAAAEQQQHDHCLILIHGAWAGSWVWDAVQPHLVAAGYQVLAVDLPGNQGEIPPQNVTLELYTRYIKDKIGELLLLQEQQDKSGCQRRRRRRRITLIAHSGAGVIAMQVAHDLGGSALLHSIIIVAGIMLPSGLTYPEFRATLPKDLQVEPLAIEFSDDGLSCTVSKAAALQCFFQDWPDKEAAVAAASKLTAQATGGLAIAAHYDDNSACRTIPKLYMEATRDASIRLPVQRAMQKVLATKQNLHVVSMDTGHVPHVVQPLEFCRLVSEFLASLE